jgi:hypothetical protein
MERAIRAEFAFKRSKTMGKRLRLLSLLLILYASAGAQTKTFRFSKAFIRSHYTADNAIGNLAASAFGTGEESSLEQLWRR